jgi:phage shock protein C
MSATRKLRKSSTNRMIAGVCGGIAEHFDIDPTLVRTGYVLLSLISTGFPGVLVYLVLAFVMPD